MMSRMCCHHRWQTSVVLIAAHCASLSTSTYPNRWLVSASMKIEYVLTQRFFELRPDWSMPPFVLGFLPVVDRHTEGFSDHEADRVRIGACRLGLRGYSRGFRIAKLTSPVARRT
jgi:hypothetical protein